jgi:hypothetical protein
MALATARRASRRRGMRGSNPVPCCFALCGRSIAGFVTCDSELPTVTARACREPAVPDAARTQHGPGRQVHRELGKHLRTARYGPILQLGAHGHRPWLSVDDRWRPMRRARRGHGRRGRGWRRRGGNGDQLGRRVRPVPGDHLPRWQVPDGCPAASRESSQRLRCKLLTGRLPSSAAERSVSVHEVSRIRRASQAATRAGQGGPSGRSRTGGW